MTEKKKQKGKPPKKQFNFYWIYVTVGVLLIALNLFNYSSGAQKVTWDRFVNEMLKEQEVSRLVVVNNELKVEIFLSAEALKSDKYKDLKKGTFSDATGPQFYLTIGSVDQFSRDLNRVQEDLPESAQVNPEYDQRKNWTGEIISWVLPIVIMIGLWVFIMRRMSGGAGGGPGGQLFNIGKSKATLFDKEKNVKVSFNDVAGLDEAKVEIQEIVEFLKNPKKYTELGAKIPKGALLVGPPGTGKTLLAKAVAGEAQVPFFSLSGSDFVEMFVGVGASRVRDLFKQAKEKAPAIIFIDEIDAIGRARGKGAAQGSNDERENTLNQLLTEMDGFGSNSGIIILAATNRAEILDRALLRPGRFDRQISVDLPELNERKQIFKVHVKPLKIDNTVDIEFLSKQTPGFSGADIANICNEAALIAARKDKKAIDQQDFLDAIDRVIGGLEKKNKIITSEEKKVIAFHEAGHASVSWLVKYANPLVKVTIVPRGRSLGAAWYLPEERQITNTEQLIDEMCAALGGRAAEEIIFGKISTGALSDLEKITKQAYAMVSIYGLNSKIGNISFYDSTGQSEYSFSKPYSEKTGQTIDEEVSKLVEAAYIRTKDILIKHKAELTQLAELLLEKEVIFKEDVERIFGKRPAEFDAEREEKKLLEQTISDNEKAKAIALSAENSDQKKLTEPTEEEISEEKNS
ncbi:ATP-dependent zinc metalloprotease FtsH [Acidiluteibacter ferrifornacis]|uniref:ATP-dependent zinc metalloprotease FtsH n=1 Tax=Acidiluteibacter ferrifornacis TaxID=2692424 RepID=A0A6N9NLM3_9FLAO|nr:ATP-dependent zinc metalloprotease FtsH [Acidiluteibacter ferrifornacis]MBR9831681.1 ATP-dependent zinc metalloprotease FtsH [bacterium]NBG66027.1 ATP-dependent zinc metalloprotease FtsH [Acidiluteibacter ferrifornacis]